MLEAFWQWLKQLWQSILALFSPSTSSKRRPGVKQEATNSVSYPALEDTDYEFLFLNLLDGVAQQGWHSDRIARFFNVMGERGQPEPWITWLKKFGAKILASKSPNNEMAQKLVQLGDRMQYIPSLQGLGQVAYDIGAQILTKNTSNAIWEYQGPDSEILQPQETILTADQLLLMLQADPALVADLAHQLGIETNDPNMIIAMLQQINLQSENTDNNY